MPRSHPTLQLWVPVASVSTSHGYRDIVHPPSTNNVPGPVEAPDEQAVKLRKRLNVDSRQDRPGMQERIVEFRVEANLPSLLAPTRHS